MEPVFVPRTAEEKAMQRALLQYFMPKNRALVEKALTIAKRRDLIGFGGECLIAPDKTLPERKNNAQKKETNNQKKKTKR